MEGRAVFAYPVLVGDIGGTNARFGIVETRGAAPRMLAHEATAGHPDPSAAIRTVLDRSGATAPRSAILAIAGRVDGPAVRLTNAGWVFEAARIAEDFGLSRVAIVNDYVPVAAGAAGIAPAELIPVGGARAPGNGARLVLGPGTGFGAAALVPYGERLAIVSTESGHTELGPASETESLLWPAIARVDGRVTVETLLSGPGLSRLHAAVRETLTGEAGPLLAPASVTEAGLAGDDPHAVEALDHFARLLGRVSGDLALVFLATGGVYVGGGIAPRILPILEAGGFRAAFEAKAPFAAMMRAIPTSVIAVADPALDGLCALANEADRFLYHGQIWQR